MREYIVTLKSHDDLQSFYDDMETEGGDLYIPNRVTECCCRRPMSRNTHYHLTDAEAELVRRDSRVLAVELTPADLGLVIKPCYTVTSSNWVKNTSANANHLNWGHLRCYEGENRSNWGSDGTTTVTGTVKMTSSGKNVDVVIVDGDVDPNHPEMAVNANGTGGTRVIQYNWFQHASEVGDTGNIGGTYSYTIDVNSSGDNHGMHVAGTVAGNTYGWAREANIYNINPYSGSPVSDLRLFEYIKAFHLSKPINPQTGYRNPTISNNSWSYFIRNPVSGVTSITFRGVTTTSSFTATQLRDNYGIQTYNDNGTDVFDYPFRYASIEADIEDAIVAGVIVVGASSNDYMKIDVVGGQDYDNRINSTGYYHRGGSPGSSNGVICVGASSFFVNERKADFSNCGPRVDIYAPGYYINSSLYTGGSGTPVTDPRNGTYRIGKYSGTSMACPQVSGVLACLLEQYPTLTQAQAMEIIKSFATTGQMFDSGEDIGDSSFYNISDSLQGSVNRYLKYIQVKPDTGVTYPSKIYNPRPTSGVTYPRVKRRR